MPQVCVTQKVFPEAIDLLETQQIDVKYLDQDQPLSEPELLKATKNADGIMCLLSDAISPTVMNACRNLKIVANVAVGFDNISVEAATKRRVAVTNTPDVLTESTADLAFGLMLAVSRRIPEADSHMRAGKYKRFKLYQEQLGVDVYGKTLGVVGLGRIGIAVARRAALGFGMKVLFCARSQKQVEALGFGATQVSFEQLLPQCDFVSIHTPLTPETHHMFQADVFKQMKRDAILINVARGPIIKEDDLAEALSEGVIRGAGIDVFEDEPHMNNRLNAMHKHVVVTPHIGSATVETRRLMCVTAANNLCEFFKGNRPPNLVNPEIFNEARAQ